MGNKALESDGKLLTLLADARRASREARAKVGYPGPGEEPTMQQQACDLMEAVVELLEGHV